MYDLYFVGIGGTLMGNTALLCKQAGLKVTGCDSQLYEPMKSLLNGKIAVTEGFDIDSLPVAKKYVIGNIISRGNPLLEHILRARLPMISAAQLVRDVIGSQRKLIAVSGTHGKSTTTAMIYQILQYAGYQPGLLLGGVLSNNRGGSELGSDYFVIEADEYDTVFYDKRSKFVHYQPDVMVINNLEFDHADIFNDLADIVKQFHQCIRTMPDDALILFNSSDKNVLEILQQGVYCGLIGFGVQADADYQLIEAIGQLTIKSTDQPLKEQHNLDITLPEQITGIDKKNAHAAFACCHQLGINTQVIIQALQAFVPLKRRFEILPDDDKYLIIDDFAHHPTAIKYTINTAIEYCNSQNRQGKLVIALELASNTMKSGIHNQQLLDTCSGHDVWIWGPAAVRQSLQNIDQGSDYTDFRTWHRAMTENLKGDDTLLIMSNGNFSGNKSNLLSRITY